MRVICYLQFSLYRKMVFLCTLFQKEYRSYLQVKFIPNEMYNSIAFYEPFSRTFEFEEIERLTTHLR